MPTKEEERSNEWRLARVRAETGTSVAAVTAGRELCELLPSLVRKAIDAGMPETAHALQLAVQEVGWEQAEKLKQLQGKN